MCWTAWFKHCYALHLWYLTSTYDVTHLFYDLYHFPAAFFHITFTVITCLGFVRLKYQACFDRPLPTISYSWPYITEGTSDLNVSPLMSHTVDVRAFKSPAIKHEQVMKQQKKKAAWPVLPTCCRTQGVVGQHVGKGLLLSLFIVEF